MLTRRSVVAGLVLGLWSFLPTAIVVGGDPAGNPAGVETAKLGDAAPVAPFDEKAGDAKPAAGQTRDEPLSSGQEVISRRYKRFEATLGKIAESLRKTDPERADLLLRAIGQGNADRISQQMIDIMQLLRDNKQLGDAIERQGDLVTQLHSLLDLLLSEDRQKELKEEQARIKKYIEEVNKAIAKEKANRADNERGAPADEVAGQQKKIADQVGNLGKQMAKEDEAKQSKSSGKRSDGKSKEGKSKAGNPGDDKSDEQKPDGAKSDDPKSDDSKSDNEDSPDGKSNDAKPGESKPGDPKPGDPKSGDAKPGDPKPGDAKSGDPKSGDEKSGDPKPGDPKSGDAKPGDAKPGEDKPAEGQPSEGQPGEGQPSEGQPSNSQPQQTPGREELEKAKRDMERAIEQLKKKNRNAASDAQDDALANLQKAKEKLEEILKQLREEERERFLAMLEARFQKMLALQKIVNDETVKLDKTPDAERSGRHSTRSLQMARQEEAIAIEATKAITLLRDEGSAVAFPEAVEQMRDDMRIVVTRLERTDLGELTQAVEKEIVEALEEMIEALQKEMEKSKDKDKKKDEQAKDSQQQDPALVDQLAELRMLRTLQLRVNRRTKVLGRMVEGEQAQEDDVLGQLQNLADRQARIQKATYDMATGRNK
jgi:hypothetical protein